MGSANVRKQLYLPLLAVLIAGAVALVLALPEQWRVAGSVAIALTFALPGYVGRMLLSDLIASRAHLARGEHERGLESARRFLATLDARPWIRHAIWTQYGMYTLNVRAMAHNNEGAALLELKRFAEAKVALQAARNTDGAYAIPLYNLAVIAKAEGDERESEALAREAVRLGFANGQLDQTIRAIGESYARLATPR